MPSPSEFAIQTLRPPRRLAPDTQASRTAVRDAPVVVVATPWQAVPDALVAAGNLADKVLIDCTNPPRMDADGPELDVGYTTSGGERVAALTPGASVLLTWQIAAARGYFPMHCP